MDDYLGRLQTLIKSKIQSTSDLAETYGLLKKWESIPSVWTRPLGSDENGQYIPAQHRIVLDTDTGTNEGSATHEHTHALDKVMGEMYVNIGRKRRQGQPVSPEESQFADGYLKLIPSETKLPMGEFSPRQVQDGWKGYRTSSAELRARGVQQFTNTPPDPSTNVAPHVDATMASEAAILRDLFGRINPTPKDIEDMPYANRPSTWKTQ
jgi:hypothetical protein